MKKRILSLLLCLTMCMGLFPALAFASEEPVDEPLPAAEETVEEPVAEDGAAESAEEPAEEPVEELAEESAEELAEDGEPVEGLYELGFSFNDPGGKVLVSINGAAAVSVSRESRITIDGDDIVTISADPSFTRAIDRVYTADGPQETVVFETITKNTDEGTYTLSGCMKDGTIRIEFAESGAGGEGPVGPSAPPENDYQVTVKFEYGEESLSGGGITVYNADGSVAGTYTSESTITVPGGQKFLFTIIKVGPYEGIVRTDAASGTENGYQVLYEAGEMTIYYGPNGPGNEGGESSDEPDDEPSDEPSGEPSGEAAEDFAIKMLVPSEEDIGSFSAWLTAEYDAPSEGYNIRIVYGTSDKLPEMHGYEVPMSGSNRRAGVAQKYSDAANDLMPGVTYYARAIMNVAEGNEEIVSDAITFTTKSGTAPLAVIEPQYEAAGEEDDTVPCTVNDKAQDIAFTEGDVNNGVYVVKVNVAEDGLYRFTLNYEKPADVSPWQGKLPHEQLIYAQLYTDEGGRRQGLGSMANDCVALLTITGETAGPVGDDTSRYHNSSEMQLAAGKDYYLALDIDGGTATASVELVKPKEARFAIEAKGAEYYTGDSKPEAMCAVVDYSVSAYYDNGYYLRVNYDLKSEYEKTGELRYSEHNSYIGSDHQQTDDQEKLRLGYCIHGLEYVYVAELVDATTGEVLAKSDVTAFKADMTHNRWLYLGENKNTAQNRRWEGDHGIEYYAFGMTDGLTYFFQADKAGEYLFNANAKTALIEVYDLQGNLLAVSTAGARWASVTAALAADTTYAVYMYNVQGVGAMATVSLLQGSLNMEDGTIESDESGADIAKDALGATINDLTKDEEGNPVPLPNYVETDEEGEAALREAIENGAPITAEVTGTELTEEDVDDAVAEAMEKAVLQIVDTETADVLLYVDISILLKLAEEEIAKVTEIDEEITFKIPITEELAALIGDKALYIIRYHGEEAESIAVELTNDGKYITFKSALFSVYGLYVEADEEPVVTPTPAPTAEPEKSDIPNTGDDSAIALWAGLFLVLAAGVVIVSCGKRKRSES